MRPGYDDRTPREEPTREPLVNLSGKPRQAAAPSAGPNPRRRRLSDMESEGREAPPQPEPTREPLVDLNVKTPQPPEPSAGLHLRRKRLSHTEPEGNEAPPQPPTGQQRRRSVAPRGASAEEPAPEPESSDAERRRPCLMSMVAAPEEAVAEEQEPRPKMGRARVTITQSPEDPAGLQSIIDPPRSLSEMLAPGQSEIVPPVTDRPAPQGHSGALVGGIAAALAAALVWALITMATGYHAGWMTMGMGLFIGGTVRMIGRGEDKSFGYLGAAVSVPGSLVGNLLSACALVASQESLPPLRVLTYICSKPALIPDALIATFQFLDLLFWAVGVYAAYRLSFRRLPPAETAEGDSGK